MIYSIIRYDLGAKVIGYFILLNLNISALNGLTNSNKAKTASFAMSVVVQS
jgi:hypothetical protein